MRQTRFSRIETAEGVLRGTMDDDVFVFRGIPYAAPPTGALRWRTPQAVTPWQGERDATQWGSASWQSREYCTAVGGGDPGAFSEDCLYLNLWTPELKPATPMPVMVWLHGGGFAVGSGGLPPYVGAPLAAEGVVIVTINYRLGHLGFFAHPALDAEYDGETPVNNFALLDQITALMWVQRNIEAFGGDKHNVTLFGESSGARSVLSLFASPLATGLFHKGIAQSAYALPDSTREQALEKGQRLARHFNLHNASAEQLRALPADAFWPLDRAMANGPVAISGDRVLPQPMLEVFARGLQQPLPLMVGSNSDEASVLSYFGIDPASAVSRLRDKRRLLLKLLRALYGGLYDDQALGRLLARDLTFTCMGYIMALAQHKAGIPGWRYYFDYVSENSRDIYPDGAWHGNEIPYVFNSLDNLSAEMALRPFTEGDRQMAKQVSGYWLAFARYATPFSSKLEGSVDWPAWHPGAGDLTLRIGDRGRAGCKLERRFMLRRMQIFRLLMRALVHLHH